MQRPIRVRHLLGTLLLLIALVPSSVLVHGKDEDKWYSFDNHQYLMTKDQRRFSQITHLCSSWSAGSYPAVITSEDEFDFVTGLVRQLEGNDGDAWVGLREHDETYKDAFGDPINDPYIPLGSSFSNVGCARIRVSGSRAKYQGFSCSDKEDVVCEREVQRDFNTWYQFDTTGHEYLITSERDDFEDAAEECSDIHPFAYPVHLGSEDEFTFVAELVGVTAGYKARAWMGYWQESDSQYDSFIGDGDLYLEIDDDASLSEASRVVLQYSRGDPRLVRRDDDDNHYVCERNLEPVTEIFGNFEFYTNFEQLSFSDAAEACRDWSPEAYLSRIESSTIEHVVYDLFMTGAGYDVGDLELWFGLRRGEDDAIFHEMTGRRLGDDEYSNWESSDEVDDDDNCGEMEIESDGTVEWKLDECDEKKFFVCRRTRETCPDGTHYNVAENKTGCIDCDDGTFNPHPNEYPCKPWQTCDADGRGIDEEVDPSITQDRQCRDCIYGEVQVHLGDYAKCQACEQGRTFFNETTSKCQAVTQCPIGYEEDQRPTIRSDRTCVACEVGTTYYSLQSEECEAVKGCPIGAYELADPTLTSDVDCRRNTTTCDDGQDSSTGNACSCEPISDACTLCERDAGVEQQYGVVLSLLDAIPSESVSIQTSALDDDVEDQVEYCANECINSLQAKGCVGFIIEPSKPPQCDFISSYLSGSSKPVPGLRLYTIPACQRCASDHAIDGFGCTALATPPTITTMDDRVTIPLNLAVGSVVVDVNATSAASPPENAITYALETAADIEGTFSIDEVTGVVTLAKELTNPVAPVLRITASDNRTECNQLVNDRLQKTAGACKSEPLSITVSVAALLGCPSDINEYVDPSVTSTTVSWNNAPTLPDYLDDTPLLRRNEENIDPMQTSATVDVGQTKFVYYSELDAENTIECSFTVSLRNGFFIEVEDIDMRQSGNSTLAYMLSSPGIADTTRLPAFTSALATSFFIGLRTSTGRPFTVSVPDGFGADLRIALRWCTDNEDLPKSRPSSAVSTATAVSFAGVSSDADAPIFPTSNDESWVSEDDSRTCVNMETTSLRFTSALTFVTLELEFRPSDSMSRRRRNAEQKSFIPAFPSYAAFEFQQPDGSLASADDLEGAATTLDLIAPRFLSCPPPESERTFTAPVGATEMLVTLPRFAAFDTVDPSPDITPERFNETLSVIDSPHEVTITAMDNSENEATCTFDVVVRTDEQSLSRSETISAWDFAMTNTTVGDLGLAFFTHHIYSEGGAVSSFVADLSTFNVLRFEYSSPSTAVPFVVRERTDADHGRIVVDMQWVADSATPGPFFGQQENTRVLLVVDDFIYADEPDASPISLQFELFEQQIVVDEAEGLVAVQAHTATFTRPFEFTSISIEVRFLGIDDVRGSTAWNLTEDSSFGVEYQYSFGSDSEPPADSEVKGFLALRDGSPPRISCPNDRSSPTVIGQGSFPMEWPDPQYSDNRGVVSVTSNYAKRHRFGVRKPGTGNAWTVVYTALDAFGNPDSCSFSVRVYDIEAPEVSVPRNVTKVLPASSAVVAVEQTEWEALSVTDNAEDQGAWATPALAWHNASSTYGLGVHTIGMDYSDAFNNTVFASVTVYVSDVTSPDLACPSSIQTVTEEDEPSANVTWDAPISFDNSGFAPTVLSSRESGSPFAIGTHVVEVNSTDTSGNVAQCSFSITVIGIESPPTTKNQTLNQPINPTPFGQSTSDASTGVIAGGGAGGALVLMMALGVIVFVRRVRAASRAPQKWEDIFKLMEQFQDSEEGPRYPREISRSALKLLGELGKGAFGVVYKGMLKEHANIPGYLVAVKSLHERGSLADRQELLEEAAVMAQFTSPHVVELVGVVTVGKPVYVIVEYMENGSLKGYLEDHDVPLAKRVQWAGDCCEGLAHVHAKGFIHRDVAARNVLLSSEMRCKISDFGLAREMEEDDTYYKSRGGQLPVRWTSIEALEDRKFNEKTDVWSCGILIHEIWTRAELPYKGWSNQKVWVEVAAGYRLPQPESCRDDVYQQMLECWRENQDQRPTFSDLAAFFRELYTQLTGEYLNTESYLEVGDDTEEEGGEQTAGPSSGIRGFLRRLSGKHLSNPLYKSDLGGAPKGGSVVAGGAENAALYDMGEDEPNLASVAEGAEHDLSDAEGADLYDMGEDDPAAGAAAPPSRQAPSTDEAGDLYDMGDDLPPAHAASTKTLDTFVDESAFGFEETAFASSKPTPAEEEPEQDFSQDLYGNMTEDVNDVPAVTTSSRKAGDITDKDVGKRVTVQGYNAEGTLRFFGKHQHTGAMRCGVVLVEPIGKNNGVVRGHKYFSCKDKHGILCNPAKVTVME